MWELYFEKFISFAALLFIHEHLKFPASVFHDFNKKIGKKKTFAKLLNFRTTLASTRRKCEFCVTQNNQQFDGRFISVYNSSVSLPWKPYDMKWQRKNTETEIIYYLKTITKVLYDIQIILVDKMLQNCITMEIWWCHNDLAINNMHLNTYFSSQNINF
jgi:hypothetical protein